MYNLTMITQQQFSHKLLNLVHRLSGNEPVAHIAEKANITRNALYIMKKGKFYPSLQTIFNLAEYYQIDSKEFFNLIFDTPVQSV